MTLVNSIDKVVDWLNAEVCPKISLKIPDDFKNDAEYNVEFIKPAAFPLYVPGKDRLPPSVPAPIPSVCVQLMEGSDDLLQRKRQLQLRLVLSCWNPGTHGAELFIPRVDPKAPRGVSYYRLNGEAAQTYTRNMEGWRDSFNFADLVLREVESTEYINGLRLMKESGVKYGLFSEDGEIWDNYPYWYNWISFTLESGVTAEVPEKYRDLL